MFKRRKRRIKTFWVPNNGRYRQFTQLNFGGTNYATTVKQDLFSQDDKGIESNLDTAGGEFLGARLGPQENLVIDRVVGKVWARMKNTSSPAEDVAISLYAAIVKIPYWAGPGTLQEGTAGANDLWSLQTNDQATFMGSEAPRYIWWRSWCFNVGPLAVADLEANSVPPGTFVDIKPRCKLSAKEKIYLLWGAQAASMPAGGGEIPTAEVTVSHDLRVLAHHQKGA